MRLKISAIGFKENRLPDPVLCVVLKCKFKVDEVLTTGQIQSFFSRTAARLRHAVAPEDDDEETDDNSRAAEEEEAFSGESGVTWFNFPIKTHPRLVPLNFCGSLILRMGDFLCFAGTNFCDWKTLVFLVGNYFFCNFEEVAFYLKL